MLDSSYRKLVEVSLPFKGRQMYMHTFDLANPVMAKGYEDYLDAVVALCKAAGATKGLAHMTVDEKIIQAGMSQRRPRPHVDGCFYPAMASWGHSGWGHSEPEPEPKPSGGGWLHICNNIPLPDYKRMSVIVVSNAEGCKAWQGKFDTEPKSDGDLSHLALGLGEVLPANVGYLLNPDCVHESMIQPKTIERTFLRIALPVDFKY